MTCPECELNKARAALWRHEAYKQGGTPLPWDVDEVIAKAVAAEREECAKVCESLKPTMRAYDHRFWDACHESAAAIRARGKECPPCNNNCNQGRDCPARKK